MKSQIFLKSAKLSWIHQLPQPQASQSKVFKSSRACIGAEVCSCVYVKIKSILKLFPHTEFFDSGSNSDMYKTIKDL